MSQSDETESGPERAAASEPGPAPSSESSRPLSLVHRCWLFTVIAMGLVFLFVLPPFQGSDEYPHWLRAWTVAQGDLRCAEVPQSALDTRFHFRHMRDRTVQITLANTDATLRQVGKQTLTSEYPKSACRYPPFAYAVPALVLRTVVYYNGRVDAGDMLKAFYAGRVFNWLFMCLAMYWFVLAMPAFRNVGLFFLSIPEVLEQASQYNTDLAQFVCMLALLATVLRTPTRRRVVIIATLAILLTLMKPVYALMGLLVLPGLVELYATRGGNKRRYLLSGALALLLPIVLWKLWVSGSETPAPFLKGVDPGKQVSFLLHHPLHVFELMWHQLVSLIGHNPMRGSWTSILGGLGPARVELPMAACFALLLAFLLSAYADFTFAGDRSPIAAATSKTRAGRLSWIAGALGVAVVIPGAVLAMYVYYTAVGADAVYGVQGRYYLVALFILSVFAIRYCRSRWPGHALGSSRRVATWAGPRVQLRWRTVAIVIAALACVWADLVAVAAVGRSYWFMG